LKCSVRNRREKRANGRSVMKNYKKKLNVYMASLVYWRTVAEINLIKIKQL